MENNGLTVTMIFAAESANYAESIRNFSPIKKMTRGDARQYSYISRQALRYNIVQQLGWDDTPVHLAKASNDADKQVVQFAPNATIADYPEIDLFGYMKTVAKDKKTGKRGGAATRSAVARLSHAVALEPYRGDTDFLTNMGLARRDGLDNSIAQSEIHAAYYAYTVAIDLDRVGEDNDISLDGAEKARRVSALLEALEYLYRDIKGRRENLSPIFAIGGVYRRKNPFFENRVKVEKNRLNLPILKAILDGDESIAAQTVVGVVDGIFDNDAAIREELGADSVASVFRRLKRKVSDCYGG